MLGRSCSAPAPPVPTCSDHFHQRSLQAMEQPLQEQLMGFFLQHPDEFTVVGPQHAKLGVRVPTISFVSSER